MDDKERFDIRRMVLAENGMDFEEYIAKQQAEIDEARKLLFEGMNVVPINKMLMKNSTALLNWRNRVIKYLEHRSKQ